MTGTSASDHSAHAPDEAAMADASAILALDQVSKTYSNGLKAISDVSLEIEQGSFLCLLGPSGCGKSTLLRMIAGMLTPTDGEIVWPREDREVPKPGEIGFVFQEPTLMPWQTVFGNVHLPLRLAGLSVQAARGRIMDALDAVGLAEFANAYPRELSGGMRMRVSIARALVTNPKVLLMDEPFAALDEITRHKLNDDLLQVWKTTGVTIIFVTHSVYESAYLADRIAVMTPRPGTLFADLALDRGADRPKDYRLTESYRDVCAKVSHALRDATEQGVSP